MPFSAGFLNHCQPSVLVRVLWCSTEWSARPHAADRAAAPTLNLRKLAYITMNRTAMTKAPWITPVSFLFCAILVSATITAGKAAEPAGDPETKSAEELVKETQNPIANLISVPFQNNFNFGFGPNDVTQWVLNVQPVIPIPLNKDWNLITRPIRIHW